jgi:hypothetical protein
MINGCRPTKSTTIQGVAALARTKQSIHASCQGFPGPPKRIVSNALIMASDFELALLASKMNL